MWSKKDSENLASIASSLEKLADREKERELIDREHLSNTPFLDRMKKIVKEKQEEIKVSEGTSIEDEALEESLKIQQGMNRKFSEAKAAGNTPFFAEALMDEDELETL